MSTQIILRGFGAGGKIIGRGFYLAAILGFRVSQKLSVDDCFTIIGGAVKINSKVDIAEGTTVYLQKLIDPYGNTIISESPMSFGSGQNSDLASVIWQSVRGSHSLGRYKYVVRAENGIFKSISKGFFYIEEE